jgi:hypothetical protein
MQWPVAVSDDLVAINPDFTPETLAQLEVIVDVYAIPQVCACMRRERDGERARAIERARLLVCAAVVLCALYARLSIPLYMSVPPHTRAAWAGGAWS